MRPVASRRRVVLLAAIMAVVAATVGGMILIILYRSEIDRQERRLRDLAAEQARAIESVIVPEQLRHAPHATALEHIQRLFRDAHHVGETTEILLGRLSGDRIEFLARHHHFAPGTPPPSQKPLAQPMWQAVEGRSGFMIGDDYRGEPVLAVYRPVGGHGLGLVVKTDLAEIHDPFVHAALVATGTGLLLLLLGLVAFRRISEPILEEIRANEQRYRTLFEKAGDGLAVFGERIEDCNDQLCRIIGRKRSEVVGCHLADLFPVRQPDGALSADASRARIAEARRGIAQTFSSAHRHEDGSLLDCEVTLTPLDIAGERKLLVRVHDCTEQQRAEQALRAERERYRTLFERMQNAFAACEVVRDPRGAVVDFRYLDVNPAFEVATGLRRRDIIGRSARKIIPDLEVFWIETYARVVDTGQPEIFDAESKSLGKHFRVNAFRTGTDRFAAVFQDITRQRENEHRLEQQALHLERQTEILRRNADNLIRSRAAALNMMQDADEARRRAEEAQEAQRQTDARLCMALQSARAATWSLDVSRNVVEWDEFLYPLFGIAPDELDETYEGFLSLVHPEDREEVDRNTRDALAGQPLSEHRFRVPIPGGDMRVLASRGNLIRDGDGTPVRLAGVCWDVTREVEAEQQRRASEERYRLLAENAAELILIHDMDGRILFANPASASVLGRPETNLVGSQIADYVEPAQRRELEERRRARRSEDRSQFLYEATLRSAQGHEITVEVSSSTIDVPGQPKSVLLIARDVTAHRQLEAELRQAQKMEAVGRLAGGVAHDFNNQIFAMRGFLDLLTRRLPEDRSLLEYVEEIRNAIDRAAGMTQQLLAFSRRQVLQPRVLDPNAELATLRRTLERLIGEDVLVTFSLDDTIGSLEADPTQFQQIVFNLAVNARDAMPRGGALSVETHDVVLQPEEAEERGVDAGRYVEIVVRDTGCGIPPDLLPKIFEPFFTTKEVGKGTGLGLSIVFGIVKQSGGDVTIESEVDVGTTFRILLPVTEKSAAASQTTTTEPPRAVGKETILLVEDDAPLRSLLHQLLQQAGYTIVAAADGNEALAAVASDGNGFDLLLSDVVMPGMSGPELARELQQRLGKIPVIFMSGYADERTQELTREIESSFLPKPCSTEDLLQRVREALDRAYD